MGRGASRSLRAIGEGWGPALLCQQHWNQFWGEGYSSTEVVGEELGEFSGTQATRASSLITPISNIEHRNKHRPRLCNTTEPDMTLCHSSSEYHHRSGTPMWPQVEAQTWVSAQPSVVTKTMDINVDGSCSGAMDLDTAVAVRAPGGSIGYLCQYEATILASVPPLSTGHRPLHFFSPDDLSGTQPPTRAAGSRVSMQCVCVRVCVCIPFTLHCLLVSPLAFPLTPFLFSASQIVPLLFSCHLFVYVFIHSFIHSFGAPMNLHTVATEA